MILSSFYVSISHCLYPLCRMLGEVWDVPKRLTFLELLHPGTL